MAFYPLEEPQLTNFTPIASEPTDSPNLTNFVPLEETRTLKQVPVTSKAPSELEKATANTIEGVAGESLALANLVASTPEFVMATGFTVLDALTQVPSALGCRTRGCSRPRMLFPLPPSSVRRKP